MLKRMLAMVLSIVMLLSLVPVQAFALDDAVVEPAVEVAIPDEELIAETDPVETVPVETVAAETVPAETVEIPDTAEPTEILTEEVQSDFVDAVQHRSASGTCGTNVSWYLDDAGTLTISGTGSMKDYSESSAAPWFAERLNIKQVVIKDGVTDIGNYAFYYCVNLQSVSIAGTVTTIGMGAFEYCTALKEITIPAGVKELYNYAFYGCSALESVSLPDTLTSISYNCFQKCTALEEIEIPDSVNYIGSDAFRDCTALKSMELPDSITSLNSCLFHSCPNLESVKIPSGVTSIGYGAFYGCSSLKEIQIPAKVTSIGYSAFYGCTSLTEVVLPDLLSYISSDCFHSCTGLTEIVIPRGVARIENGAFCDCVNLTSVSLSSGLVTIGEYAFYNCVSLNQITIPDGTTTINYDAFGNCVSLKGITIPETITALGARAFKGCTGLTEFVIPRSLSSVSTELFRDCTSLVSVTVPETVKTINASAFYGCTALKSIELPAVETINSRAFYNCTALKSIEIPAAISISESAFYGCTALKDVAMPAVTSIGEAAFRGCTSLESVILPDVLETISGHAFRECTNLKKVELPACSTMGGYVFYNCTVLSEITLPDNLETIGEYVFKNCDALEYITIPEGITSIGQYAFNDCDLLKRIVLPERVATIGQYAFYSCGSLQEVVMSDGLVSIPYHAFYDCSNLEKVTIPATVTEIGEYAFVNCPKLTEITFHHTVDNELYIDSYAFGGVNGAPITVFVPYARNINNTIKTYNWAGRQVTYRSFASLPAATIAIETHPAQVEAGLEVAFTANVDPWYCTSDLIWEVVNVSGEAVIDSNGVLIGMEPGYVTVICKSSDDDTVRDESQIEILKPTAFVSSISIRCEGDYEAEIELGDKVQMIADVKPGNAMNKKVTWEVENGTGTATISKDGVLTGLTCGTVTVFAIAQDGSEVIGSRMIEIMRYVTDIQVMLNGREDFSQLGVSESARLTCIYSPEDANHPTGNIYIENGTGAATYRDGYLTGETAGTVTLKVVAADSRQLTVTREIEIVGEKASYAVAGGNLYYNTVTGTIIDCDTSVSSANIPAIINGTRITAIAPKAFYNRDNLTSVTIPSSVTVIGEEAFYSCENITSLRINGNGLQMIGRNAFRYCRKIVNLTIPEGVKHIGEYAFYECNGLLNLTIPEGIEYFGNYAFNYLSGLKNLTIPGDYDTRGWLSYSNVLDTVTFTGTKIHPGIRYNYDDRGYDYESIPGRHAKKVIITDSVTEIGMDAFRSRDSIEEVVIGNGVVTIGEYAFYGCGSIASITIGANVKTIGNYGFYSCTKLAEVVLPDGIETLGERAFEKCYNLESINLPASLKSVGRYCFSAEKEGGAKLQLIDLSSNPAKMAAQEMQLKYSLPKVLVDATGKKNEIYWSFVYTWEDQQAGKPNPWDIAHIDHEGTLYSNGNSIGTVTVLCCDEYTGATGTWEIEISSGVVIRTDREEDYLVSGDAMQLSAWIMPGNIKTNVNWSIREQDKEFAAINSTGKLTARAVNGAKQIEVTATPYDGGESATLKVWIVPRTTSLYIYEGKGDVTGLELDIDSFVYPSVQLEAVAYPEGAMTDVYWTTSDENVASVDNGLVTFNGLGTVTISVIAGDGSGKSASVTLNVSFRESARKLVAIVDAEDNTLRSGETAQIWIYGSDEDVPMDPSLFEFGVPGSQTAVATVDDGGLITAGEKAGTATITASMREDPLGRRVSIMITVKARQTEKLLLHALADEKAQVQMLDGNGNVTSDVKNAASYSVLMKKADVENEAYSFVVRPEAFHSAGSFLPEMTGLKWASSNSNVATVVVQRDGTAIVTVKQGASGACVISAVTNDESKIENSLILNVRDYAPRLETFKPVLNTYQTEAATMSLLPSYGNWIESVALMEDGVISERLEVRYDDGILTIVTRKTIPNCNLNPELWVTCNDGNVYQYGLAAKVKNTVPSATIKQSDKLNLFYTDSKTVFSVTAKDAVVTHVELKDTADFTVVEYDTDRNQAVIRFSDSYIFDHSEKPDTKGTLLVYFDGYEKPQEKSITISTMNQKPNIFLSEASSTVNAAISKDYTTSFGFVIKGSDTLLNLRHAQVEVEAAFAECRIQNDRVVLDLHRAQGGAATVWVRLDNWMESVKLSHKVTVETKNPVLKFGAAALKLNSIFTDITDSATVTLSHSNLEISSISFTSTAMENSAVRAEADKLELSYDPYSGTVTARIADPDNAPNNGNYIFNAVATLPDGTELSAAKLKVTLDSATPKVKLKNSTLKLNTVLAGHEIAVSDVSMTNGEGYSLVDFRPANDIPVDVSYVNGQLTASLPDEDTDTVNYTVILHPILLHEATGQEKELPTAVPVRVQVYENSKISVALSSKGKLDAVDPDSEIRYTVSKITNATGPVTGVSLDGPDAELFDAVLNDDGTVSLKMLPGETYSVKRNYNVQFNFCICGMDVPSAMQSFKISQSALDFTLKPDTLKMYQSQTTPVTLMLTLAEPVGATMESIVMNQKSDAGFLDAMGDGEMDVTISADGRSALVEIDVRNPAKLQFGKSYTLYLDVCAAGSAVDGKQNSVKITVEVEK